MSLIAKELIESLLSIFSEAKKISSQEKIDTELLTSPHFLNIFKAVIQIKSQLANQKDLTPIENILFNLKQLIIHLNQVFDNKIKTNEYPTAVSCFLQKILDGLKIEPLEQKCKELQTTIDDHKTQYLKKVTILSQWERNGFQNKETTVYENDYYQYLQEKIQYCRTKIREACTILASLDAKTDTILTSSEQQFYQILKNDIKTHTATISDSQAALFDLEQISKTKAWLQRLEKEIQHHKTEHQDNLKILLDLEIVIQHKILTFLEKEIFLDLKCMIEDCVNDETLTVENHKKIADFLGIVLLLIPISAIRPKKTYSQILLLLCDAKEGSLEKIATHVFNSSLKLVESDISQQEYDDFYLCNVGNLLGIMIENPTPNLKKACEIMHDMHVAADPHQYMPTVYARFFELLVKNQDKLRELEANLIAIAENMPTTINVLRWQEKPRAIFEHFSQLRQTEILAQCKKLLPTFKELSLRVHITETFGTERTQGQITKEKKNATSSKKDLIASYNTLMTCKFLSSEAMFCALEIELALGNLEKAKLTWEKCSVISPITEDQQQFLKRTELTVFPERNKERIEKGTKPEITENQTRRKEQTVKNLIRDYQEKTVKQRLEEFYNCIHLAKLCEHNKDIKASEYYRVAINSPLFDETDITTKLSICRALVRLTSTPPKNVEENLVTLSSLGGNTLTNEQRLAIENLKEASIAVSISTREKSTDPTPYHRLGECAYHLGMFDKAVTNLRQAIELYDSILPDHSLLPDEIMLSHALTAIKIATHNKESSQSITNKKLAYANLLNIRRVFSNKKAAHLLYIKASEGLLSLEYEKRSIIIPIIQKVRTGDSVFEQYMEAIKAKFNFLFDNKDKLGNFDAGYDFLQELTKVYLDNIKVLEPKEAIFLKEMLEKTREKLVQMDENNCNIYYTLGEFYSKIASLQMRFQQSVSEADKSIPAIDDTIEKEASIKMKEYFEKTLQVIERIEKQGAIADIDGRSLYTIYSSLTKYYADEINNEENNKKIIHYYSKILDFDPPLTENDPGLFQTYITACKNIFLDKQLLPIVTEERLVSPSDSIHAGRNPCAFSFQPNLATSRLKQALKMDNSLSLNLLDMQLRLK